MRVRYWLKSATSFFTAVIYHIFNLIYAISHVICSFKLSVSLRMLLNSFCTCSYYFLNSIASNCDVMWIVIDFVFIIRFKCYSPSLSIHLSKTLSNYLSIIPCASPFSSLLVISRFRNLAGSPWEQWPLLQGYSSDWAISCLSALRHRGHMEVA